MGKIKTISNSVPYSQIRKIPTDKDKREDYLLDKLKYLANKHRYCPALGAKVFFEPESIDETSHHASKSHKSAVCALNLQAIIRHATLVDTDDPKENRQKWIFNFSKMYILYTHVRYYGTAKLTVGKRMFGGYVQYCVTSMEIRIKKV